MELTQSLRMLVTVLMFLLLTSIASSVAKETKPDEENEPQVNEIQPVRGDEAGYCATLASDGRLSIGTDQQPKRHKHHRQQRSTSGDTRTDDFADNSVIPDGNKCCSGRQDRCSMPYKDTICYCDTFCKRDDVSDCCPDYESVCAGGGGGGIDEPRPLKKARVSTQPTAAPPKTTAAEADTHKEIHNNCLHESLVYNVGEVLEMSSCKKCTCVASTDASRLYHWNCDEKGCVTNEKKADEINVEDSGWKAVNYPEFADKKIEEVIIEKLGARQPSEKSASMSNIKIHIDDDLPDQFDARQTWPGLIGPPMNQGNCGASWAFSTAAVASDRMAIHSRGSSAIRLSPQQLVSCVGHHAVGQTGCHPVSFDRAWWFVRKTGLVTDECYPYTSDSGEAGACLLPRKHTDLLSATCPSSTGGQPVVAAYRSSPPYKIEPQEREIMKEIFINGPVQSIMIAKDDLYSYKSGVYRSLIADDENPSELEKRLHSVKIIGWGTDHSTATPHKYWLCANSWGQQWGEDGHFRIARGTNESGIETLIVGVWMRGNGKRRNHHEHRNHYNKENTISPEKDLDSYVDKTLEKMRMMRFGWS